MATKTSARFLSRKRKEMYDRIIRVNLAGELGADRIYWGQMAVLGKDPKNGPIIQEMWNQEKEHLKEFELLAMKHRVPRSFMTPLWSVGGFLMGAGSALLGPRAAMACTVAVEKTITQHYNDQLRELVIDNDPVQYESPGNVGSRELVDTKGRHDDLIKTLSKFRDDEQHHHDTGLANEAELTPGYKLFTKGIETVCKVAVKIAERI